MVAVLAPLIVQAEEASPSPAKGTSRVDSQALQILRRMSTTLGAAKAFTYRSTSIQEVPAKTGQFITLFSTVEVALKRPNKLRARLTGEAPHFDFYFDGATASAFAPASKVYSTVEARSTIDTMLPALQQETGIRFASAPLLFSDPYGVDAGVEQRCGRGCGGRQWTALPTPRISISRGELGNLDRVRPTRIALATGGNLYRPDKFPAHVGRVLKLESASLAESWRFCLS